MSIIDLIEIHRYTSIGDEPKSHNSFPQRCKKVRTGQKVTIVKTADGNIFSAGAMALSAGAWSGETAKVMGLQLPVIPSPKMAFHVDPAENSITTFLPKSV